MASQQMRSWTVCRCCSTQIGILGRLPTTVTVVNDAHSQQVSSAQAYDQTEQHSIADCVASPGYIYILARYSSPFADKTPIELTFLRRMPSSDMMIALICSFFFCEYVRLATAPRLRCDTKHTPLCKKGIRLRGVRKLYNSQSRDHWALISSLFDHSAGKASAPSSVAM